MLAKGKFTLKKFVSNVRCVLSTLNRTENPTNGNVKALVPVDESSHVLEIERNYRIDSLVVSRRSTSDRNRPLTQRVALRLVSAVYDPNGLVSLYTVETQLLMKDISWLSGQQRNDSLPDLIIDKFVEWIDEQTKLTEITIPRIYFDGRTGKLELQIFRDSSQLVFCQ